MVQLLFTHPATLLTGTFVPVHGSMLIHLTHVHREFRAANVLLLSLPCSTPSHRLHHKILWSHQVLEPSPRRVILMPAPVPAIFSQQNFPYNPPPIPFPRPFLPITHTIFDHQASTLNNIHQGRTPDTISDTLHTLDHQHRTQQTLLYFLKCYLAVHEVSSVFSAAYQRSWSLTLLPEYPYKSNKQIWMLTTSLRSLRLSSADRTKVRISNESFPNQVPTSPRQTKCLLTTSSTTLQTPSSSLRLLCRLSNKTRCRQLLS